MQHLVCLLISDWFFLLVAVILLGACAYYWKRLSKGPWTLQIGSALLVSGAIGNGIDRYMIHGVVDFLISVYGLSLMLLILAFV